MPTESAGQVSEKSRIAATVARSRLVEGQSTIVDITVSNATHSDVGELTAIAFAAKRHWAYPEAWIEVWTDELTVEDDYVRNNHVFVAKSGSRMLGWYALAEDENDHWLDFCWVLPEAIGQGIGRRLVSHAFESAAELGWSTLKVIADPNAEGFYCKLGFRRIGEHPSMPKGRQLPVLEASVAAHPGGDPEIEAGGR